jgi:hypothetical protein
MEWDQQLELIKKEISNHLKSKPTNATVAAFFAVSLGKVQAWTRGQRPSADDLAAITRKLSLNPAWILLGEGEMFRTEPDPAPLPSLGDVALKVHGLEQAHLGVNPDATEDELLDAILPPLEARRARLRAKRTGYGAQPSAREPHLHEDHADYPEANACGIDRPEDNATQK